MGGCGGCGAFYGASKFVGEARYLVFLLRGMDNSRLTGGHRSGGVHCRGHQVVESCGCTLYCGPDGTAVLKGGGCAAGGSHDFGEFEETSMVIPLASRDITRATGGCVCVCVCVYADMGWGYS